MPVNDGEKLISFIWETAPLVNWILGSVFILLVFIACLFILFKIVKRKGPTIFTLILLVLILVSYTFDLTAPLILLSVVTGCAMSVIIYANLGDFRAFISTPFKRSTAKAGNFGVEKVYDRKALNKIIETTVMSFSKSKIGAIITFEKATSLKDICRNGVPVNAPVTFELLSTIFYPGTRLHDGAVVIHDNEIVSASVFYAPTTKAYAGKYGSRHRAAIGISEVSDSVTVVVSEETGRISFAVNGELEIVEPSSFLTVLEKYLDVKEEE